MADYSHWPRFPKRGLFEENEYEAAIAMAIPAKGWGNPGRVPGGGCRGLGSLRSKQS